MARSFWAGWLFLVPFTWLAQEPSLAVLPMLPSTVFRRSR